jgi:hypothetical protein
MASMTAPGDPVGPADAARLAALPPVSVMLAALLGYKPIGTPLRPALGRLPGAHLGFLTATCSSRP